jgi:hypothetical protein
MPKSKGRKPKNAARPRPAASGRPGSGEQTRPRVGGQKYDVGKLRYPLEAVGAIAFAPEVSPDLAVELLPAALWIHHLNGRPANACVDAAMTLRHCYEQLGIESQILPVDLVVSNQQNGQRNLYGTPTPSWDGRVFHGHCVVYLPGSRRFLDATVEQYPEVRGLRLGPICGKMAGVAAHSDEDLAAFQRGVLPAGAQLGVKREHLLLLYTTLHGRYADVVDEGLSADDQAKIKRSGINLAAMTLDVLRHPDAIGKARRAPHRRVQQLLKQLDGVESEVDDAGDVRYLVPGYTGGHPLGARLDELPGLAGPSPTTSGPERHSRVFGLPIGRRSRQG